MWVVYALTAVQIVGCVWRHAGSVAAARPFAEPAVLDLNRATVAELALLPGIGPHRARAIVLHRVRHGRFRSIEELGEVDGLGKVTVQRIAARIQLD